MYTLKKIHGYISKLSVRETERAIKLFKDTVESFLAVGLNLDRVSAPLLVPAKSGLNDDLSGVERIVRFDIKEISDYEAEVVQSLAKWKRMALYDYGFGVGEGLYTDMNAIRRDDTIDNTHSIYVDQWDWELVISREQRTVEFLESVIRKIVSAIVNAQNTLKAAYPQLTIDLEEKVFFITSQELKDRYPELSPKEREHRIAKEKKTVFIMQIGGALDDGFPHDGRAPDYDDWSLNGDLLFWNEILNESIEISSMGIRVDAEALKSQLITAEKTEREKYDYHQGILKNKLPLTIGGGIGQSRLCMLVLQKLHIGEVQASIWPKAMIEECKLNGIELL